MPQYLQRFRLLFTRIFEDSSQLHSIVASDIYAYNILKAFLFARSAHPFLRQVSHPGTAVRMACPSYPRQRFASMSVSALQTSLDPLPTSHLASLSTFDQLRDDPDAPLDCMTSVMTASRPKARAAAIQRTDDPAYQGNSEQPRTAESTHGPASYNF